MNPDPTSFTFYPDPSSAIMNPDPSGITIKPDPAGSIVNPDAAGSILNLDPSRVSMGPDSSGSVMTALQIRACGLVELFDTLPDHLQMDGLDLLQGVVNSVIQKITAGRFVPFV